MGQISHVFISHSQKDAAAAAVFCRVLEEHGLKCWIAPRDIVAGEEWAEVIVKAIAKSDIVVLLVSTASVQSKQVLREVECAVSQERRLVPVRIEDIEITGSLKYFLGVCHWIDAFRPPVEDRAKELVTHLTGSGNIEQAAGASWAKLASEDDAPKSKPSSINWKIVLPVTAVVLIVGAGYLFRFLQEPTAVTPSIVVVSGQPGTADAQASSAGSSPLEKDAAGRPPLEEPIPGIPLKLIDTHPHEGSQYCIIEHTGRGTHDVFNIGESVWGEGTLKSVGATWVEIDRKGQTLRLDWKNSSKNAVLSSEAAPASSNDSSKEVEVSDVPLKLIDTQIAEGAQYCIIEHTDRETQDVFSIGASVWGEGTLKAIGATSVEIDRKGQTIVLHWKTAK